MGAVLTAFVAYPVQFEAGHRHGAGRSGAAQDGQGPTPTNKTISVGIFRSTLYFLDRLLWGLRWTFLMCIGCAKEPSH